MSVIINGTDGVQFNDSSLQGAAASPYGLKNRIINGDMRIDQRNAGASITANASAFPVDRFKISTGYTSKATIQQSTTAPAGFNNSVLLTSTAATSTGSGDYMTFLQVIEGYNIADLNFGTANAKTITFSFWVRSSVTGTYGGVIQNGLANRSYVFTYTVSAANTWEQKTITIAGDTSGTWETTNGSGFIVRWSIVMGSAYTTSTTNTWLAGDYEGYTGQTQLLNTNGATWYVTGVQLEVGSTATPFERRQYGQELALCQRYFNTSYATGTATGTITNTNQIGRYTDGAGNWSGCTYSFPSRMRATPSITTWGVLAGATSGQVSGDATNKTGNIEFVGTCGFFGGTYNVASGSGEGVRYQFTASSEL